MLDPMKADCRVVTKALACSKGFYDDELALVSHDSGPMIYAGEVGLTRYLRINEWLLDPEPGEAAAKDGTKQVPASAQGIQRGQTQEKHRRADARGLYKTAGGKAATMSPDSKQTRY